MKLTTQIAFDSEIKKITSIYAKEKESEDNWQRFDSSLAALKVSADVVVKFDNFMQLFKRITPFVSACILSERSRLSGSACELIVVLAQELKHAFEPLADNFIPSLLKLGLRANKVFVLRSTTTLEAMVRCCGLSKLVLHLSEGIRSPNKAYRTVIVGLTELYIQKNAHDIVFEHLSSIENVLRTGLSDADSSVREKSRQTFMTLQRLFPVESARFLDTLPSTAVKHLGQNVKSKECVSENICKVEGSNLRKLKHENQFQMKKPSSVDRSHDKSSTTARVMASLLSTTSIMDKMNDPAGDSFVEKKPLGKDHRNRAAMIGNVLKQAAEKSKKESEAVEDVNKAPPKATPRRARGFLGPAQRLFVGEDGINESTVQVSKTEEEEEVKKRHLKSPKIKAFKSAEIPEVNFVHLLRDVKKSDWNTRLGAYQQLYDALDKSLTNDKVMEALVQGLEDTHVRIVSVVLNAWNDIFNNYPSTTGMKYHESLLPRLLGLSDSQMTRNRTKETINFIIETIKSCLESSEFLMKILNILNIPEYANNARVKQGAISHISETITKVDNEFLNKLSTFRMIISRVVSCASDADKTTLKRIGLILFHLHNVSPDLFFETVSHLSLADRSRCRQIVGKDIEGYKQKEEFAVNSRAKKPSKIPTKSFVTTRKPPQTIDSKKRHEAVEVKVNNRELAEKEEANIEKVATDSETFYQILNIDSRIAGEEIEKYELIQDQDFSENEPLLSLHHSLQSDDESFDETDFPEVKEIIDDVVQSAVDYSTLKLAQGIIDDCIQNALETKVPQFSHFSPGEKLDFIESQTLGIPSNMKDLVYDAIAQTAMDLNPSLAMKSRKLAVKVAKYIYESTPEQYETEFLTPFSRAILKAQDNPQMLASILSTKFLQANLPFAINF